MDLAYLPVLRRNVPPLFSRALQETLPFAYRRAVELAEREFQSNLPWMLGNMKWGLSDDAFVAAAERADLNVNRVRAENGMTHVEIYTDELIMVPRRATDRNDAEDPKYRKALYERNTDLLSLFGPQSELEAIARSEDERLVIEIVHGCPAESPEVLAFLWLVIPNEEGDRVFSLPLQKLHPGESYDKGGIEVIPDGVGPVPRTDQASAVGG